jgi:AcrR family transcriptional regulator
MTPDDTNTKGERTRAEIMQAAHALFLDKGYNAASMRQIAEQAAITPAAIYNHFASKEDIFSAVFNERHPYLEMLAMLDSVQESSADFESVLRGIAQRMVAALSARPDFLNLLFIEMIEFKGAHLPPLVEKVAPRVRMFIQRLDALQSRERLRPLPLPIIQRAFIGMFIAYAVSEQLIGILPPEYQTDSLAHFVDIFLHGVLQPQGQPDSTTTTALPEDAHV